MVQQSQQEIAGLQSELGKAVHARAQEEKENARLQQVIAELQQVVGTLQKESDVTKRELAEQTRARKWREEENARQRQEITDLQQRVTRLQSELNEQARAKDQVEAKLKGIQRLIG
jgi:chromosome segregation ATPase